MIKFQNSEIIDTQVCDGVKNWDLVAYFFWGYFCKAFGLCVWFLYSRKLRQICATSWSIKNISPPDLISATNENYKGIQSSEIIGMQVCDGVKNWYLVAYLFWGYFSKRLVCAFEFYILTNLDKFVQLTGAPKRYVFEMG